MAFPKRFERELDKLFRQRTHWLRSELGLTKPGKPPVFDRTKVDKGISKLQSIVSDAFARTLAKTEFEKHAIIRKTWHIKGHGYKDKKKQFDNWFAREFDKRDGCVYVFWGNHRCIYVGRTGKGGGRPSQHFKEIWLPQSKRVTIYPVKSKSHIPKLECLAIHRFQPKEK